MWFVIKTDIGKEKASVPPLKALPGVADVWCPVCVEEACDADGNVIRRRFSPTISGTVFLCVGAGADGGLEQMRGLVNEWGWLQPSDSGQPLVGRPRLMQATGAEQDLDQRLRRCVISDADIEKFRVWNSQMPNVESLRVFDSSYPALARANDVVRITEGPYKGFEGVVKQVRNSGKGTRKEHCLFFSMGCWTVCVPDVRRYRGIVIREAREGAKAQSRSVWRQVDCLLDGLQAAGCADDSASVLRMLLKGACRAGSLGSFALYGIRDQRAMAFIEAMDARQESAFASLFNYFASSANFSLGIDDLVPDAPLRPFLTLCGREGELVHSGFVERVSSGDGYYVHLGFCGEGASRMAFASWGGFARRLLQMSVLERGSFASTLQGYGLSATAKVVGAYDCSRLSPEIYAFCTPCQGFDAPSAFCQDLASAAHEMWHATRLLEWSEAVKRWVMV